VIKIIKGCFNQDGVVNRGADLDPALDSKAAGNPQHFCPLACIGKFRKNRGLGFVPVNTFQPKLVHKRPWSMA